MTDLEELVRATLAHRADDTPSAQRLAEAVRARRRRSRRTRQGLAVVAAAAATAAAVVIPLTLTASPHAGRDKATAPPPAPKPATERLIGFHGIELTVPASWKINDTRCGTPVADTVIRDEGGVPTCLIVRPRQVNSVELQVNTPSMAKTIRDSTGVTNARGVYLMRGHAGRDIGVIVPSVGVLAFVHTTAPALADRIINSIELTKTDSTGCNMRETPLQAPFETGSFRVRPYVISPTTTAIAICHYEDNWLVSSAVAAGPQLANIVHAANTAPFGLVHTPRTKGAYDPCSQSVARGGEAGSGFILLAHDLDGTTQRLWAHIGFCGPLGITNGGRAGALTEALASAITAPLHTGFAFPNKLLPGPG